jgi:UDP-N-acetylmuramate--alanine ligase
MPDRAPGRPAGAIPGGGPRPDLSRPRRVHIVGAGGAGMSAIGTVLIGMGHQVSGSDEVDSPFLRRLAALGATVHVGHDPAWLDDPEVVARSTAIPAGNVELAEAERRGLRVWRRSELLAAICAQRRTAAVSGTHGKTTTSSMLAVVLDHAGLHPSIIVGGDISGMGSGARWDPSGEWMVVEADESDGTFLELGAEAVVVTSVEPDHLDFYGSRAVLEDAFARFVRQAPGPSVVCADDPGAAALVGEGSITYGTSNAAQVRVVDYVPGRAGSRFAVLFEGRTLGPVTLAVPGLHNARNAAAALAVAHALGVPWERAVEGIGRYRGVARRFETRGERHGVTFIDDYGHLPTEVAVTLAAARSGGWKRIVAVFQPHRYSRTEALWPDFADAFEASDILFVTAIYPAGERPRPGVSGELIFNAVRDRHPEADVRYVASTDALVGALLDVLRPGDLCLTMGAGDLTSLPDRILADVIPNGSRHG